MHFLHFRWNLQIEKKTYFIQSVPTCSRSRYIIYIGNLLVLGRGLTLPHLILKLIIKSNIYWNLRCVAFRRFFPYGKREHTVRHFKILETSELILKWKHMKRNEMTKTLLTTSYKKNQLSIATCALH